MAILQPIVRDARRQVMDVVEAEPAGKPLLRAGHPQEEAPADRCGDPVATAVACPVRVFEVVLKGAEPNARKSTRAVSRKPWRIAAEYVPRRSSGTNMIFKKARKPLSAPALKQGPVIPA